MGGDGSTVPSAVTVAMGSSNKIVDCVLVVSMGGDRAIVSSASIVAMGSSNIEHSSTAGYAWWPLEFLLTPLMH